MSIVVDRVPFLCFVVVFGIGWFVARWKWRKMVARSREMRRRMALAAAEASRAEAEADASYRTYGSVEGFEHVVENPVFRSTVSSPARQVQLLCEVCGIPTTTRCKECKSVRYCSGKCQIMHWRQGHRDECAILAARRTYGSPEEQFQVLKTAGSSDYSSMGSEDHSISEPSTPSSGYWEENNGVYMKEESNSESSSMKASAPDFKYRHHSLSSKLSVQNTQGGSSLDLRSNEKRNMSSSHVLENTQKQRQATKHSLGFDNPESLRPTHIEARNCHDILQLNALDKRTACNNYFSKGTVGELGASHIFRGGDGLMSTYKGSFSYEDFVKLYNWNDVDFRPRGLANCGNSCYANAVLQCLAFTPPLTAYFLQSLHSKDCKRMEWCFSCEFEDLVHKLHAGRYPVSPERIMSKINSIGTHLVHGKEEDAHEFLRYAIDCMQLGCLREAGAKVPISVNDETTLFSFTFGGYLRSKIECMRCGGISEQHERMMDLAVEIGGDVSNLEDALRMFTRSEVLDGDNKYLCSRCKSYERAKKKLRVLEAPNVLMVALKRFQNGKHGKLHKRVEFPEILDLAPYMSGTSEKSPIYRLYGVVVHIDSALSGHYMCYVQNNQRRWFEANDSRVEEVKLEKVLSRDAYMLFYARCWPRSPRLARSIDQYHDSRKLKSNTGRIRGHTVDAWNASSVAGLHYLRRRNASCISDESSESSFFSDGGSYGTETSFGESTSSSENFEQLSNDIGNKWVTR